MLSVHGKCEVSASQDREHAAEGLCVLCSMSLRAMCQHYVLPLACNSPSQYYERRWLTEPHIQELACALHITVHVHDVCTKEYAPVVRGDIPSMSGMAVDLLFHGHHYEPLYR